MKRLDFVLPEFARTTWVSDNARATWEPRLDRVANAWRDVEWRSVASGLRDIALVALEPDQLLRFVDEVRERGLAVHQLARLPGAKRSLRVGVGTLEALAAFEAAGVSSDDERVSSMRGTPACCAAAARRIFKDEGWVDPTWPTALATAREAGADDATSLQVSGPVACNVFLRRLGVRAVPHVPCRFDCAPSAELGARYLALLREAGHAEEAALLEEILSWPVEWSALHGIAETKTPVLRLATRTDATAGTLFVHRAGGVMPEGAARGLASSHARPSRLRVLQSASFRRSIERARDAVHDRTPDAAPWQRPTPRSPILEEAVAASGPRVAERRIARAYLDAYFTLVALDDGSVGAAMSSYRLPVAALAAIERSLVGRAPTDALPALAEPVQRALGAALASAVAVPILRAGGDRDFSVSAKPPDDLFAGARSAVVVGFGGYLPAIAADKRFEAVHVLDLTYPKRRSEMDRGLDRLRARRPELRLSISDGSDAAERLAEAELASITGSALGNGTMESLLEQARGCRRVIVQGQSAAILPAPLFARGVAIVATTIKPDDLIDAATRGQLRTLLEGGLPWVYLTPYSA